MNLRGSCLLLFVLACLCSTSILAQDKAASDRSMLARVSGAEIPEDNPMLKYLQTVHLSLVDQLRGTGSMEWSDTGTPPEGKEANVKQMRDGLQTMIGGFFQSWNAYMNGSMVPFPDKTVDVTTDGFRTHLHGTSANVKFDEDYDQNMLLTQAVVETPEMKVVAVPTYVRTDDGLIVASVTAQLNRPPSAPPMVVTFRVEYAKVDSFQIPSHVVYDIKNVGVIEVAFRACQVSVANSPQDPAAEKSNHPTN